MQHCGRDYTYLCGWNSLPTCLTLVSIKIVKLWAWKVPVSEDTIVGVNRLNNSIFNTRLFIAFYIYFFLYFNSKQVSDNIFTEFASYSVNCCLPMLNQVPAAIFLPKIEPNDPPKALSLPILIKSCISNTSNIVVNKFHCCYIPKSLQNPPRNVPKLMYPHLFFNAPSLIMITVVKLNITAQQGPYMTSPCHVFAFVWIVFVV